MSVKVMGMVFELYPVGGGEMLLALSLADFSDDQGGRIFPSVSLLAKKTRQSERSVQYQLRKMENDGFITFVAKNTIGRSKGGAYPTREYRINLSYFDKYVDAHGSEVRGANTAPLVSGIRGANSAPPDSGIRGENSAPLDQGEGCNLEQSGVQTGAVRGATAVAPYPPQNHPSLKTPTTTGVDERTQEPSPTVSVVVVNDYIFPPSITANEQAEIMHQLKSSGVPQQKWQILLDELHGVLLVKPLPNPIGYMRGMAKRMANGSFSPERSVKIAEQRAKRKADDERPAAEPPKPATPEQIAKLPFGIRAMLEKKLDQVHL